jgi:limonene-1,2-epoxide hydrolase
MSGAFSRGDAAPPMKLLFEGSFQAYFRAASLASAPCVFVHVPKTAGTSLRREIAALMQPDVNIVVDYTDTARSFHERIDAAVDEFLLRHAEEPVRFASGHIFARHVERIAAATPDTRFVTFLRDPVSRVVSDYLYQRSPKHPPHEEFAARVPDLDTYLTLPSERNKMAEHLVPRDMMIAGDTEACVRYLLSAYAFIGVQELYPLGFRALTRLVGTASWPKVRENVGSGDEAERAVPPDLAERVRAANPIDVALYEAVAPRWARVREALAKHLA